MNEEEILLATSCYQNVKTAIQSINDISDSVKDKALLDCIIKQKSGYEVFASECEMIASTYGVNLKDNNWFEKARLWTSIKMTTLTDKSTRHLAEMLLLGTVMGTLTCYKDLADHKNSKAHFYNLAKQLLKMEENNFNEIKKFLTVDCEEEKEE